MTLALVFILSWAAGMKSTTRGRADESGLGRFLPQEVEGWRAAGKDNAYNRETIFEYIDGAGEVYRSYNFQNLLARRYSKTGQPDIIADFFDMGSAAEAFGVFTHGLEGERLAVGQGAVYTGGLLSFWKDRYFVSLYMESETPETRPTLEALGRAVSGLIPAIGRTPDIISLVPSSFDAHNARYFHNHLILNYHFFVSTENILRLDDTTEAVLATSGDRAEKAHLLIVKYPAGQAEEKARLTFIKAYLPDAVEPGVGQTENKKWTGVDSRGPYLAVVFDASTPDAVKDILKKVIDRIAARTP